MVYKSVWGRVLAQGGQLAGGAFGCGPAGAGYLDMQRIVRSRTSGSAASTGAFCKSRAPNCPFDISGLHEFIENIDC